MVCGLAPARFEAHGGMFGAVCFGGVMHCGAIAGVVPGCLGCEAQIGGEGKVGGACSQSIGDEAGAERVGPDKAGGAFGDKDAACGQVQNVIVGQAHGDLEGAARCWREGGGRGLDRMGGEPAQEERGFGPAAPERDGRCGDQAGEREGQVGHGGVLWRSASS